MDPLGYVEFMSLVRGAAAIVTDSGGVQEETTLLRVPCLTLRPNTERPITVTSGSNRLVTRDELAGAVLKACDNGPYAGELPPLWDGQGGPRIARIVTSWWRRRSEHACDIFFFFFFFFFKKMPKTIPRGYSQAREEMSAADKSTPPFGITGPSSADDGSGRGKTAGTSPRTPGLPRSASGCRGSCATRACSWP